MAKVAHQRMARSGMHIDFKGLIFNNEGDVETRLLVPFSTGEPYLNIQSADIYSKDYFPPAIVDKGAKAHGYMPDYSVWLHAFSIMVIEAKAPGTSVEQGYKEAALYAQQRNARFPPGFNPTNFIIASDGLRMLLGYWDSNPEIDILVSDMIPGSVQFERILTGYGISALKAFAAKCLAKARIDIAEKAFNRAGGHALAASRKPLNSFAAELSPVLTKYFSSAEDDVREIAEKAYISSTEITEYDKVLEALLRDRTSAKKNSIVEQLEVTRHQESRMDRAISDFGANKRKEGQLQIIQGSVGAGKSLFIRRFQQVLQGDEMKKRSRWAWVDFNSGPSDLSDARAWLCDAFAKSFEEENPEIDMSSLDVLKGIFSKQIQRRKPIYDDVARNNPESAARLRGEDLIKWQDDPDELASGIANLIMGVRHEEVLIVVLDNVDRLDLQGQLDTFQLALWFLKKMKCFVVLQMRDETYERYKDQKPLDTFKTGIAFHISPPRFVDVVRRRLDLSIAHLSAVAAANQSYVLPSGMKITIPTTQLGVFLAELYSEIFEKRRNISRILESLAGLNVRRALDMFVSIVTSGHLKEDQITSQVRGAGAFEITEYNILKILMRGQYRFFNENSSFIMNVFQMDSTWKRPSNFVIGEILFLLSRGRKEPGQIGLEGYFSVQHVADRLQHAGLDPEDVLKASILLLNKYLVVADHMNNVSLQLDDCIKITASGYIHLRTLCERIEYIYGVLPSTRIADEETVNFIVDVVKRENTVGDVSPAAKAIAVKKFYDYLVAQAKACANLAGWRFDEADQNSGMAYVVRQVGDCVRRFHRKTTPAQNALD